MRIMMTMMMSYTQQVKMFIVITMAYLIFWGPLFIVTLANYTDDWKAAKKSMAHEVDYP